jgi:hypothetical protein
MSNLIRDLVEIKGAKHTSEWLMQAHFKHLLASQAPDMTAFVEALHAHLHHMSQLGIFKTMDVLLDIPTDDVDVAGEVVAVDVVVRVEERPKFFLKTGTEFAKNEASLVFMPSALLITCFLVTNRSCKERVWKRRNVSSFLCARN